jgi:hypothetical protein
MAVGIKSGQLFVIGPAITITLLQMEESLLAIVTTIEDCGRWVPRSIPIRSTGLVNVIVAIPPSGAPALAIVPPPEEPVRLSAPTTIGKGELAGKGAHTFTAASAFAVVNRIAITPQGANFILNLVCYP